MATFAACATLNLVVLAMAAIAATRAASLSTIDKEKTDENRKRAHRRLRRCHS